MLSNQWTISLTSLVMMLALALVSSYAVADEFGITLDVANGVDISFADGIQAHYERASTIKISSAKVVQMADTAATDHAAAVKATTLEVLDFEVIAYNKFGGTVDPPNLTGLAAADPADGKHFTITLPLIVSPALNPAYWNIATQITRVVISIPKHAVELADPRAELGNDGTRKDAGKSKAASVEIHFFFPAIDYGNTVVDETLPVVCSIKRPDELSLPVTSETFDVVVTLSEEPKKDTFKTETWKDRFDVSNGEVTAITALGLFDYDQADCYESTGDHPGFPESTIYKYLLTVKPTYANTNDIVIKILDFESQRKPGPEKYPAPATDADREEGTDKLTVKVGKGGPGDKAAGHSVALTNLRVVPKDGYLIVATDLAGTGINLPKNNDADNNTPVAAERTPAQRKYNAIKVGLPNLEFFLLNGGTIDLVSPNKGLIISEIMWGSDRSLNPNSNSQWIEIRNTTTADITTGDGTHKLIFYGPNEDLPGMSVAANNIQDRVGTVGAGGYWPLTGKGSSGASGIRAEGATEIDIEPTVQVPVLASIVSMQRDIDAAGVAADGTMASSWAESVPPGLNFTLGIEGVRVGTPGAKPVAYPVAPTPEPVVTPDPVAMPEDIMITEIMVDTGDGRLPQWIELSNVSGKKVSLAGWSLRISNSDADADVVGSSVSIDLSGSLGVSAHAGNTGKGQSLLLVAWGARSSSDINADLVMNVSSQVGETGRYTLISEMGFMVALIPLQTSGILAYGDTAGNLDAGWELPTAEGARSSLIRREMDATGMATMGTMANGWMLASDTALVKGPATWYGSDEDAGTPGYDAGGPLPVELSHFRPARDKETGAAVITWSTQSELNNAGFFIKRNQQRDGQFQVINAAMIQGAGTTSEKQFYTYTDTTAQPNVVYYYQIEDVSLDGNHQTLTRGIRLKGHIGAAGKLTSLWGELKTSNE